MATLNESKLNTLFRTLPEGLLVDSTWLRSRGYSSSLCSQYVAAGWLEQPARRVYQRTRTNLNDALTWQQVVISLQTVLDKALVVGGRTALELQGLSHYLSAQMREVHLYGPEAPPTWLDDLPVSVTFRHHTGKRLFTDDLLTPGLTSLDWNLKTGVGVNDDPLRNGYRQLDWGPWNWPLTVSTVERAILELLDQLPNDESFHQADKLMEGLTMISPRRMAKLLTGCRSVKVKRLFFFFAERHQHRWLSQLDPAQFDLGAGNRVLVKGGKLNSRFHITVPEDLDGLQ